MGRRKADRVMAWADLLAAVALGVLVAVLLSGCTQTHSGEVGGAVLRVEELKGKCPTWEVELMTSSRIGEVTVHSDSKPDLMVGGAYRLRWTATTTLLECPVYKLEVL
jgi:hypothetical protein